MNTELAELEVKVIRGTATAEEKSRYLNMKKGLPSLGELADQLRKQGSMNA